MYSTMHRVLKDRDFVTVFYEYHFLRKLITSNHVFRYHVCNPHRVFCITSCFQTLCILPQSTGMMHIVDFFCFVDLERKFRLKKQRTFAKPIKKHWSLSRIIHLIRKRMFPQN